MKNLFVILTALLSVVSSWSCSSDEEYSVVGGIYGSILDSDTNQPVYGATVTISPTNTSTTTGADGGFVFLNLEAGQYKLTVTKSDYQYNSRQVTVVAGQNVIGDMTITPAQEIVGFSLSSESLIFGSTLNELPTIITNNSSASSLSWSISSADADWFTVSPTYDSTALGASSSIIVTLKRDNLTSDMISYFIVNAGGGSKSILVSATKSTTDDSSSSSSSSGSSSSSSSDLSGVGVSVTDSQITASITSVSTSSTNVTIGFSVSNSSNSSKYVTFGGGSNFMYPTFACDNLSNYYDVDDGVISITLGGLTGTQYSKSFTLSAGGSKSGTITISGVPTSATSLDEVAMYFSSPVAGSLQFTNIPIR